MIGEKRLSFIGGGNMAEAMLKGLLQKAVTKTENIFVSEPRLDRVHYLSETYQVQVKEDNLWVTQQGDVIILAVKPQVIAAVLTEIAPSVRPDQLVVSIAAGISTALIAAHLGSDKKVVRAMPNTPAQIGAGVIALCGGRRVGPADLQISSELFNAIGTTVILNEGHMDAVTGLSGSGPAYIFLIIEALTEGGVKMGLPREIAQTLVVQTLIGSGRLVLETGEHPARLKDMVTSPGGTTIAGLSVLEEKAVRSALINAVVAACERSRQLAQTSPV